MPISSRQTTMVAGTPVLLLPKGNGTGFTFKNTSGNVSDPLPVTIKNEDTVTAVYLGGPDVSATQGQSLAAGETVTMNLYGNDLPYAFVASGTPIVSVMVGRQ